MDKVILKRDDLKAITTDCVYMLTLIKRRDQPNDIALESFEESIHKLKQMCFQK